ncbi:hypothetical protein RKD46_008057 [Streptomyces pseudovenezuelae]
MPADTSPTTGHATAGAGPGDLGRRLLHRRGELGLTRREVADRAGMAPGYLRYLEESPAAHTRHQHPGAAGGRLGHRRDRPHRL